MNLYKNTFVYLTELLGSQKTWANIRGLYFPCIFEYIFFANLFVNIAIIRNSKINWKIYLREIFHISPYYKFLNSYLFEIRSFHSSHLCLPFCYLFRKFRKLDGSHGRHLLAMRTENVMSYFFSEQYFFWYIQ